jgi:hypothetical protein
VSGGVEDPNPETSGEVLEVSVLSGACAQPPPARLRRVAGWSYLHAGPAHAG